MGRQESNGRGGHLSGQTKPRRLLLVDDDPSIRTLLRLLVQRHETLNLRVAGSASNGREALDVAVRVRPHAIVLDAMMPVLDGLAALPLLRDLSPDAFIVIYSGADETEQPALEAGADAWVSKTTRWDALLAALSGHVTARRASLA